MKAVTNTVGISRSNQCERKGRKETGRRKYRSRPGDENYLDLIKEIIAKRPSNGYRRVTVFLNRKLDELGRARVNHKRVYRIMRVNGLLLHRGTDKPVRTHDGKVITLRNNQRWCSDGLEILCWNEEKVRISWLA